jgi:hypothetical protein
VLFEILRAFGWIEFDLHHLLWQQNVLKSMCGLWCKRQDLARYDVGRAPEGWAWAG